MPSYNISDLTVRDGKLYAGGVEVGARDRINTYNPTPAESAPSWMGGTPQASVRNEMPTWALAQNLGRMLPDAPQNPNDGSWGFQNANAPTDPYAGIRNADLGSIGDFYRSQVDPLTEFANTGNNRMALYGSEMQGVNPVQRNPADPGEAGPGFQNMNIGGNPQPFSSGAFGVKMGLPDISKWTGEEYNPTGRWVQDASDLGAKEAQQILKQFYPNISQADLDKAAYTAMQSGDRYYGGPSQPAFHDDSGSSWYHGTGPLPTVTAIAKQLGGVTPELNQFLTSNWDSFGARYAKLREEAQAKAKAEDRAHITGALKGITGVVGGAFGLSGLLNGGLGSLLGGNGFVDALGGMTDATGTALSGWGGASAGTGAAGAAGSGVMDWSNLLSGLGDTTADLGGNWWDAWNPSIADSAASAADWGSAASGAGSANWWDAWNPNISDPSIASPDDWGNAGTSLMDQAKNWLTNNPGSTLKTALQAITSGSGGDLSRLIGGLGAAGLGAYASNQQSNDLSALAKRYEGYGAPYRQKLSDLYANPDSFLKSNEVQKPVQMGTDNLMRSLSMQGNPFGSGNALQQGQSYASDQLFGRLGQEKDRLAGFGGLAAYNGAAPQASTNAISSSVGGYRAAGDALGNIFSPPQTESQTMANFMKMMGK